MTVRPILFSATMVRAIIEGRKTQTRRTVKWVDECPHGYDEVRHVVGPNLLLAGGGTVRCPYGVAGDRLWVREAAMLRSVGPKKGEVSIKFRADPIMGTRTYDHFLGERDYKPLKFTAWTPGIHMPRWACRLVLEVVSVRAERLQAISKKDAIAEGFREEGIQIGPGRVNFADGPVGAFRAFWKVQNAKRAPWDSNPWVWVVEFRRVQ